MMWAALVLMALVGGSEPPAPAAKPPMASAVAQTPRTTVRASSTPARLPDAAWGELRGRVIASPVFIAPELGSDGTARVARQFQASTFSQSSGFWRLHLVAFLEQPADGPTLTLIIEDESASPPPQRTREIELQVQPGTRIVRLNNLVISDELGYRRGHSYALFIQRPAALHGEAGRQVGKRDVIARGVITLW